MSTLIRLRSSQRGFSLIEIMVAVFVLSIGLLGMAALMATSLRNSQSAAYRSQAINLAYDALEMMRANKVNTRAYRRNVYSSPTASCAGAEVPFTYNETSDLFTQDRNYWARKLCRTLPNGRGRVLVGGTIATGYTATINVCWSDNRSAADADAACPVLVAGEFGACSGADDGGSVCVIRVTSGI